MNPLKADCFLWLGAERKRLEAWQHAIDGLNMEGAMRGNVGSLWEQVAFRWQASKATGPQTYNLKELAFLMFWVSLEAEISPKSF